MLKRHVGLGALAFLGGCATDQPAPTQVEEISVPVFAAHGGGSPVRRLATRLSGKEEVFTPATPGGPTPADSRARGKATFRISRDGGTVHFTHRASRISNIIMSHIHCGPAGANGPIRMWLSPVIGPTGAPRPGGAGPHRGVISSGSFSPVGIVCPASAVGRDMPLLDAMRAGLTYVNVHTNDGVAPTNTGPGDFPGGEIRGQLDDHKSHDVDDEDSDSDSDDD